MDIICSHMQSPQSPITMPSDFLDRREKRSLAEARRECKATGVTDFVFYSRSTHFSPRGHHQMVFGTLN